MINPLPPLCFTWLTDQPHRTLLIGVAKPLLQPENAHLAAYVIMLLVPVFAGTVGYVVYSFTHRPVRYANTAHGLMLELCRLHHISEPQQVLLQTIAEIAEVPHPAILCIIPDRFDAAVEQTIVKLSLAQRDQKMIRKLRQQLFD